MGRVDVWGSRWSVLVSLLGGVTLLIGAGFLGQVVRVVTGHDNLLGLVPLLNPDREFNLPSLVSVALLAACSGLLFVTAREDDGDGGRRRGYWWLLGGGFLVMAIDEWLSLHERLIPLLRTSETPGIFHFAWVMVALPLVVALGALFARFWWRLPDALRWGTALAAGLYLGGALGVEMIGGVYASRFGEASLAYAALVAMEEWCEMAGVVALLATVLAHIDRLHASVGVARTPAPVSLGGRPARALAWRPLRRRH